MYNIYISYSYIYIIPNTIYIYILSHRIHGAAIYGNMDPINIPHMLAYIAAPWIRHGYRFLYHKPWNSPIKKRVHHRIPGTGIEAYMHTARSLDEKSSRNAGSMWVKAPKHWGYPLVNSHNYGKSPFLMGKSTINGHFQ